MTTSFFSGTNVAPEADSTNALIDNLTSQVATVTAANSQAQAAAVQAEASASNAAISETNVSSLAQQATTTLNQAQAAIATANTAVASTNAAVTASATNANTATTQAGIATTQATAASTSATNAATSESNSAASAAAALVSQNAAKTSENNSASSASSASASASSASTSATTATNQASSASTSAGAASSSAAAASTSASSSATQATNSSNSASASATSASQAATSATNAANSATAAATSATNAQSILSSVVGKNRIINGDFRVNQRAYASGAATTGANQYTFDRWRVVVSGQSLTFAASANGNLVTAPAGGMEQAIEGNNIEGGTFTLSWTGTAAATVNGSAVAKNGQVTLTANTNATVRFSGGTVGLVQLEAGTVATPFERRSYGLELALCQRYYETGVEPFTYMSGLTGVTSAYGTVPFLVQKRTNPTMVLTGWKYYSGGSDVVFTPTSVMGMVSTFTWQGLGLTSWCGWDGAGTWTASAEL